MKGINHDAFEDSEVDIDLRRCPAEQIGIMLDLVRFDCFLDYIYVVLLKRNPDREGRVHYRGLSRSGLSRRAIVRRLLRSREYGLSAIDTGGLGVEEFVNRVYQDILGRRPDQEGLDTYRRIASRPNGKKRVIANLRASAEAVRKGGGRFAKIEALRAYAKVGWPSRLPVIGRWFARRHWLQQRLDRMTLNQRLLAQRIARLEDEFEAANLKAEPFGFMAEAQGGGSADMIFNNALIRARREA